MDSAGVDRSFVVAGFPSLRCAVIDVASNNIHMNTGFKIKLMAMQCGFSAPRTRTMGVSIRICIDDISLTGSVWGDAKGLCAQKHDHLPAAGPTARQRA